VVKQERDFGIDILKAASIILVLVWHINPFTSDTINPGNFPARKAIDLFYRYISLLSVPNFIAVSLFLFVSKATSRDGYFNSRILRLSHVFLFWMAVQYIVFILATGNKPSFSLITLTAGGPGLPRVGGSVFYFLLVLIKCTILSCIFLKLSKTLKSIISVIVIAASCVYFVIAHIYQIPICSMRMINYCVYIPVTFYLFKYRDLFVRYCWVFIICFILSVCYEEFISRRLVSVYGRLSIFFGVLSLMSMVLSREFGFSRPIELLSRYSLGIFAVHKYWQYIFLTMLEPVKCGGGGYTLSLQSEKLLLFSAVVICTLGSVYLLNKTKLRIFIT
jgi:hypothetical protein